MFRKNEKLLFFLVKMSTCLRSKKYKHYADNNRGKSFYYRMKERLTCDYNLSLYERMTYPYFCIVILNDRRIPLKARSEFLENFVKPYISDQDFRLKNMGWKPVIYEDIYLGCMEYDEIEIIVNDLIKKNNLPKYNHLSDIVKILFEEYDPHTYGCLIE